MFQNGIELQAKLIMQSNKSNATPTTGNTKQPLRILTTGSYEHLDQHLLSDFLQDNDDEAN